MRGLPPVTIRTAERQFRSGPNLLSDLKVLAVDGLAPKWFSFSTTQDSMGNEWITVIYQRSCPPHFVRDSPTSFLLPFLARRWIIQSVRPTWTPRRILPFRKGE